jgi:hypothetical protein
MQYKTRGDATLPDVRRDEGGMFLFTFPAFSSSIAFAETEVCSVRLDETGAAEDFNNARR